MLVDTGAGEFFWPGFGVKLVSSLAAVDVFPQQMTDVLHTHAYDADIGGLVHGGRRTFPNAIVHMSKADLGFLLDRRNAERTNYAKSYFEQAALRVGRKDQDIYRGGGSFTRIDDSTAPGHTLGRVFYGLKSYEQEIVFNGDIIYVASVQAPDPETTITYDVNPTMAAAVRQQALSMFADSRTLVAVPHLPFSVVGHFRRAGKGFEWVPISYANRQSTPEEGFVDPHKLREKH